MGNREAVPRKITQATIEHRLAERGRSPRGCYQTTLFGCGFFEPLVTMCLVCPWRNWSPGEPVPPEEQIAAAVVK